MPHYLKIVRSMSEDEKQILRESVFVVVPLFFWYMVLTAMDDMAVQIFFDSDQLAGAAGLLSAGLAIINTFGRSVIQKLLALACAGVGMLILWYLHDLVSYNRSKVTDQFFLDACYSYVVLTFLGFYSKLVLRSMISERKARREYDHFCCHLACVKALLHISDAVRYCIVVIFTNLPIYAMYGVEAFDFQHDVVYYNGTDLLIDHELNETIDGIVKDRPSLQFPFWAGLGFVNLIAVGMLVHRLWTSCWSCCSCWTSMCSVWDEPTKPAAEALPPVEITLSDEGVLILAVNIKPQVDKAVAAVVEEASRRRSSEVCLTKAASTVNLASGSASNLQFASALNGGSSSSIHAVTVVVPKSSVELSPLDTL